ncbi:MAG: hypothetical protein E7055_00430 [Lentisphaerae bacterium]|nr:hypothetical protein [Lentisphaerota bacterium]
MMKYALLIFTVACLVSGCVSQPDSSSTNPEPVRQTAVSGRKNPPATVKKKTAAQQKTPVSMKKTAAPKAAKKPQSRTGIFCGDVDVEDNF